MDREAIPRLSGRRGRRPAGAIAGRRLAWLVFVACAGCSQAPGPVPGLGGDADFERAVHEYERGNPARAIELLEGFERSHPGSRHVDDALFYLGKAHQGNQEHILARQDFERLLSDYPRSSFAEEAHFELARSWYLEVRGAALDPEPAEEALRSLRAYLRRYPEGRFRAPAEAAIDEILAVMAEKDYLNGRTYLRLKRPAAARRYFEKSLATWSEAPVSAQALAGIARSFASAGEHDAARGAYERLAAHLADHPEAYVDGAELAAEARRFLGAEDASGGSEE